MGTGKHKIQCSAVGGIGEKVAHDLGRQGNNPSTGKGIEILGTGTHNEHIGHGDLLN